MIHPRNDLPATHRRVCHNSLDYLQTPAYTYVTFFSRGNVEDSHTGAILIKHPYDFAIKCDRHPNERWDAREGLVPSRRKGGIIDIEGDICLSFWRLSSSKIYIWTTVLSLEICYARSSGKRIWENSRLDMYRCRRDCWSTVDLFVLYFFWERWRDEGMTEASLKSKSYHCSPLLRNRA